MITMQYKPLYLPQVNAPADYVLNQLKDNGVSCTQVETKPNKLTPMQGIVFSDTLGKFDEKNINPIWISNDNSIVDGHHRWVKSMMAGKPILAYKVNLNGKDAARILNKIQDIYEYEQQQKMEEVISQDPINNSNRIDSEGDNDFIYNLEEMKPSKKNNLKIMAYRKEPLKKGSVIGNFFILDSTKGYDKYEIEFDNLLNTNDLGIVISNGENPIDALVSVWFPNVDFEKLSKEHNNAPIENLKMKAITERAKRLGYDGIKYGDIMLQGLK